MKELVVSGRCRAQARSAIPCVADGFDVVSNLIETEGAAKVLRTSGVAAGVAWCVRVRGLRRW